MRHQAGTKFNTMLHLATVLQVLWWWAWGVCEDYGGYYLHIHNNLHISHFQMFGRRADVWSVSRVMECDGLYISLHLTGFGWYSCCGGTTQRSYSISKLANCRRPRLELLSTNGPQVTPASEVWTVEYSCVCVCVDGSIYTHRCVYVNHAPSGRVLACGRKLHAVPIRRDTTVEPLTPLNASRRANITVSCWWPPPPPDGRNGEFHRNGSSMCDRIQFLDKSLRERYEHALGLEWHTHTHICAHVKHMC